MVIPRLFRAMYRWLKLRISPPPSLAETAAGRIEAADRDHAMQLAAFDRELAMSLPPDNHWAQMPANDYWHLGQSQASALQQCQGQHAASQQYQQGLQNQLSAAGRSSSGQYGLLGAVGLGSILGHPFE